MKKDYGKKFFGGEFRGNGKEKYFNSIVHTCYKISEILYIPNPPLSSR